jgi:LysR family transcriptional regulator, transcriptional activator of nhaA
MHALNLHWLYYFWMAAKEGGMTAAANKLGVTQPTVSALIRSLEDSLGQKLFDRSGRSLKLSESGAIAFKYAEDIFNLGKEMQSFLLGSAPQTRHPFRIGITDVVPKIIAQRLIDPAYAIEPAVSMRCLRDSTQHLLAALAVHELDLVISDGPIPPTLKVKAFDHPILECGVTLVAHKSLARKLRPGFPRSLTGAPLLLPTSGSVLRQSIDLWLEERELAPFIRAEFDDTGMMKIAGAHAHGAFAVPELVAKEVCKDYQVERVKVLEGMRYKLYLISLERKIKHPVVAAMAGSLFS